MWAPSSQAGLIPARYYDGRTARGHNVRVRLAGDQLLIDSATGTALATWPFEEVEAAGSWEGRGPFALTCRAAPDARLLLPDGITAAELRAIIPQLASAEREGRRRGLRLAVIGTLAAALLLAFVYEGAPRLLASAVPSYWLAPLGETIAADLRRKHGSCGQSSGQWSLERLANRFAADAGYDGRIGVEIVDWHEVNALALPGDRILILRGLLIEADQDELAGVLAHEVGHVVHRHVNQAVVRVIGADLLLTLFTGTGDVAAMGAAALAELGYSRAAEAEADRFAVAAMRSYGLRVSGLRRFFERMAAKEGGNTVPAWLSTHPDIARRAAAIPADNAGVNPFTAAEWLAISSACR